MKSTALVKMATRGEKRRMNAVVIGAPIVWNVAVSVPMMSMAAALAPVKGVLGSRDMAW